MDQEVVQALFSAFIVVAVMLLVSLLALGGAVRQEHAERLEICSWYWHFVDAVWIVVFLTVYVYGV